MAYKTEELLKKAIEAIKEYDLIFIEEVVSFLPCSKPTLYKHKLDEVNELKELLEKNRINTKIFLRNKWRNSDNATLQMALYKLLASEAERKALAMEYHDHSSGGEKITINFKDAGN